MSGQFNYISASIAQPVTAIAFFLSLSVLAIYVGFLLPRQITEIKRPKDWLTRLRWMIFTLILLSIVTSVPSVVYQAFRLFDVPPIWLSNIVNITTNVSRLAGAILMVLIFTYKYKEGETE